MNTEELKFKFALLDGRFVQMLHIIDRLKSTDAPQLERLVVSLNHLAHHNEDWAKVENYAQIETVTVDIERHAMSVKAVQMLAHIEGRTVQVDALLGASLEGGHPRGQCIVGDDGHSYSSAYGLTSGVHFFETLVLTKQLIKVGWKTRGWTGAQEMNGGRLIKQEYNPVDDHHFIGFYGFFPLGTVLSCLLDATQRSFAFTVNGAKGRIWGKMPFSANAYYVQASSALLYFNFGQVPFKYPPAHLAAGCSPTDLPKQAKRYALYHHVKCMPLFGNQVEPFFADAKQGKVKATLEQLVKQGELRKESVAVKYGRLWKKETFRTETVHLRWLQAIIEMEKVAGRDVNEWAVLVESMVDLTMSEPWISQLEAFILPYSKLHMKAWERSTRAHTLVILFATMLQYSAQYGIDSHLSPSLSAFLLSTFLATADLSTAMFTLIGLATVKEELSNNKDTFTEKLEEWKRIIEKGKRENRGKMDHSLAQLHLVIHHVEHSLPSSLAPHPATATPTSLSPSAYSSAAKLSPDCLSLRSDFKWQSARSHLSVDNLPSLEFSVFYFEATLLTSGPMRIGWASEQWQINRQILGDTELSFGYDGSTGCIWHQDVQWRVRNATKWQAGDVIGCLLDLTRDKEKFTFYQNGEAIQMNGDIHSRVSNAIKFQNREKILHVYEKNDSLNSMKPFISKRSYYVALSLGPYQQGTVNLGHAPFCFPPKCIDYLNFQQYSEHLERDRANKRFKVVNIGSATNSIISIQGKTTTGDFSVNQSDVSTNPTTEPRFSILEPTVCQVCNQQTDIRRRTLEGCPHLAFCANCASKNITCKECPQ